MSSTNQESGSSEFVEGGSPTRKVDDCSNEVYRLTPVRMDLLLNAAKALASTTDINYLLQTIVGEVQTVIDCEGAGVLLYDEDKDDFYWKIVQDRHSFLSSASQQIRIPKNDGVCGWVFNTGQPALVHDAANDPRLYRAVDATSGFQTRNMICVPLQAREKRLGVLYALNKTSGSFSNEDVDVMSALASNVALALENASYYSRLVGSYKELERLNRAKGKMIHHLSHELKTPLAIIEASLVIVKKKVGASGLEILGPPFERIERNLDRLKTVERQASHIVEDKEAPEKPTYLDLLDKLEDLIEIEMDDRPWLRDPLEFIRERIKGIFPDRKAEPFGVSIDRVFEIERDHAALMMRDRKLEIIFEKPDQVVLKIQPHVLQSTLRGLVRNAIENTPDHGKIEIAGYSAELGYAISIKDYGVGIPEAEQPNIFEGFYPVQDTDIYSSGRPYAFNAGGTGTDLLKMKIFAQRIGYTIRLRSSRCSRVPTSRDLCPGDIGKCSCCSSMDDCLSNGGTEFLIEFPSELLA